MMFQSHSPERYAHWFHLAKTKPFGCTACFANIRSSAASAVARAIALSMADVVESASSDEMPDLVESTSSDDSDAEEEEEESDDGDMFDLAALEDDGREETNASRLAVEDWNTVLTTARQQARPPSFHWPSSPG